jgi:hypothetical protein
VKNRDMPGQRDSQVEKVIRDSYWPGIKANQNIKQTLS